MSTTASRTQAELTRVERHSGLISPRSKSNYSRPRIPQSFHYRTKRHQRGPGLPNLPGQNIYRWEPVNLSTTQWSEVYIQNLRDALKEANHWSDFHWLSDYHGPYLPHGFHCHQFTRPSHRVSPGQKVSTRKKDTSCSKQPKQPHLLRHIHQQNQLQERVTPSPHPPPSRSSSEHPCHS